MDRKHILLVKDSVKLELLYLSQHSYLHYLFIVFSVVRIKMLIKQTLGKKHNQFKQNPKVKAKVKVKLPSNLMKVEQMAKWLKIVLKTIRSMNPMNS